MAFVTISPNMGMPVPVVNEDPGPDWATNVNSCLSVIDGHNHSSGSGVAITPDGMNINSDLTFQNNNLTNSRSVRFFPQSAALSLPTDLGCLYEAGVDLYYNDGLGNQIRITQSGSVAGSTGTITGLPSGTASASFSAGTFRFESATSTPATMAVGPLVIGRAVASSNTVTLAPSNSIASNYSLFMPPALPAALNYMTLDASGNIAFNTNGSTGSGAVVLSASPTLTGTLTVGTGGITFASGNMVDYANGTWTPTLTGVSNITSITTVGSPLFQRTGDIVICWLRIAIETTTNAITNFTVTLPVLPTNNFASSNELYGIPYSTLSNFSTLLTPGATSGAKTATISSGSSSINSLGARTVQFVMSYNVAN